ncbi:hypothetical protein Tco_0733173, partial [Tanacetum coccineum]
MFTFPFGTYAYRRMPFGLCNAPATFQRCMLAIFHDMIEETVEVFMDDVTPCQGGNARRDEKRNLHNTLASIKETKTCVGGAAVGDWWATGSVGCCWCGNGSVCLIVGAVRVGFGAVGCRLKTSHSVERFRDTKSRIEFHFVQKG